MATVYPTFIQPVPMTADSGYNLTVNDNGLRLGRVYKTMYPGEPGNLSKTFIEYEVMALYSDGWEPLSSKPYHAILMDSLAGLADTTTFTLREGKAFEKEGTSKLDKGSLVLFQCINGNSRNAVIVGGYPDRAKTVPRREEGHNLFSTFNGVRVSVNKDGEFQLDFTGPTRHDGSPADKAISALGGSLVKFSKDGSVKLASGGSEDQQEPQTLLLDTPNKRILLEASTGGIEALARGGDIHLETDKDTHVDTNALVVNDGSQAFVRGTVYRDNEKTLHTTLSNQLTVAVQGLLAVAASLAAAAAALSIPISGPPAAAPSVAAAAGNVANVAQSLVQCVVALNKFEAGSGSYLTKKHRVD